MLHVLVSCLPASFQFCCIPKWTSSDVSASGHFHFMLNSDAWFLHVEHVKHEISSSCSPSKLWILLVRFVTLYVLSIPGNHKIQSIYSVSFLLDVIMQILNEFKLCNLARTYLSFSHHPLRQPLLQSMPLFPSLAIRCPPFLLSSRTSLFQSIWKCVLLSGHFAGSHPDHRFTWHSEFTETFKVNIWMQVSQVNGCSLVVFLGLERISTHRHSFSCNNDKCVLHWTPFPRWWILTKLHDLLWPLSFFFSLRGSVHPYFCICVGNLCSRSK